MLNIAYDKDYGNKLVTWLDMSGLFTRMFVETSGYNWKAGEPVDRGLKTF